MSCPGRGASDFPEAARRQQLSFRISTTASPFGEALGARFTHSIASSFDFT